MKQVVVVVVDSSQWFEKPVAVGTHYRIQWYEIGTMSMVEERHQFSAPSVHLLVAIESHWTVGSSLWPVKRVVVAVVVVWYSNWTVGRIAAVVEPIVAAAAVDPPAVETGTHTVAAAVEAAARQIGTFLKSPLEEQKAGVENEKVAHEAKTS